MPTYPDPAALYPEVAAAGSLAAALRAVAAEQGLSVPVPVTGSASWDRAEVPTTVPHRADLRVSASLVERRWFVTGEERHQRLPLVVGDTPDLAPVARVARAWHDGAALADLAALAPWVRLTGRFEVPDGDPARLVESEWQHLRTEAGEIDWPGYRALIEAAYAEPRLRRLYPYTSHWALRFATRTRPRLSDDVEVCLHAGREDRDFRVTVGYVGQELGTTGTAGEAVAVAVRHLPAGLPPVTS